MSKLGEFRRGELMGDPIGPGLGLAIRGAGRFAPRIIRGVGKVFKGIGRLFGRGRAKKLAKAAAKIGGAGAVFGGAEAAAQAALGVEPGAAAPARKKGRGITARELRGFRKVTSLLRRVGMVPKGLRGARRRAPC